MADNARQSDTYKDLVDSPNETLSVEYKSWLDLDDPESRADLAKHIAALANHGGGMIVFGFNDDLTPSGDNPFDNAIINRDTVSAIVKKYLEPTFQCDVEQVKSRAGKVHPVVVVPSHGSAPICAKAGGPEVGGKPKGIVIGNYYVRKPGPESERIMTSAEWVPVIRRCALHERAGLLAAIEAAIQGTSLVPDPDKTDELKTWHDAAYVKFKADVEKYNAPATFAARNVQFSYSILRGDGQRLDPQELRETLLMQIHNEVMDRVRTGWSMMYPFSPAEISPYFTVDEKSGEGQEDFIECSLLRKADRMEFASDMWRVTPSGKVTIIRPYWEDDSDWNRKNGSEPGTSFDPKIQVRSVAEFVRHSQAFAEKFDVPVLVNFLCEWRGLSGRSIRSAFGYYSIEGAATADGRKISKEVPIAALANSWPEIVSDIVAPVVRLFNSSFRVNPEWIKGQAPSWLR
jgi:Putative DNA-binding domain